MDQEIEGEVDFDFFDSPSRDTPKTPVPSTDKPPTGTRPRYGDNNNKDSNNSSESCSSDSDSDNRSRSIVESIHSDRGNKSAKDATPTIAPQRSRVSESNSSDSGSEYSYSDDSDMTDSDGERESGRQSRLKERRRSYTASSSAYSNSSSSSDEDITEKNRVRPKTGKTRSTPPRAQAWNTDIKTTSHIVPCDVSVSKSSDNTRSHERRFKNIIHHDDSGSDQSSVESKSDSDSEITDVSPLATPNRSPQLARKVTSVKHNGVKPCRKSERQYQALPVSQEKRSDHQEETVRIDGHDIDLKMLMHAMMELDSDRQKRIKASTRRVVFAPSRGKDKANYSFNSDRAMIIERENQRLLDKIMKSSPKKKSTRVVNDSAPFLRKTHASLNRHRQQRRIEQENMVSIAN